MQPISSQKNHPAPNDGNSITAASLQRLKLPPIKWIVPDLLPAGITVLAGSPKSGKSWLALDLALSVASGAEFLGQDTQGGDVLYYALEDSVTRLQGRVNSILRDRPAPDALHLAFALNHDQMVGALRDAISWHNPSLVVIDTVGRLGVKSTSHYDAVYAELSAIKLIADEAGISIVCVTHTRKQPAADPFAQILGSTAIAGTVDTMWVLRREGTTTDTAHLHITGRDVSQQALRLRFSDHRWQLLPDDVSSQMAIATPLFQFLLQIGSYQGLTSSLCGDYILYCLSQGIDNNLSRRDTNVSFGRQLRQIIPLLHSSGKQVDIQHTKAGNMVTITSQTAK